MRDLNIFFKNSIEDLIFLLDRNYPRKQAIELVGNRYGLNHNERMILYRGVFDRKNTALRKEKRIHLSEIDPDQGEEGGGERYPCGPYAELQ